ncbi:MAG: AI-2E family transporter [Methylococcales bacterium]
MNQQDHPFSNIHFFKAWLGRVFPNTQAISLAVLLVLGFFLVIDLSDILMPVFASGVIAYLLEGLVSYAESRGSPRMPSVSVVYVAFLTFLIFLMFALLPVLYQQTVQLFEQLPSMISRGQLELMKLPEQYPQFITVQQIDELFAVVRRELIGYTQKILSVSATTFFALVTLTVYMILIPILVFFFMKDNARIIAWFVQYLPRERHLSTKVWREVDAQIGNYVRGKFIEVLILGLISYVTFSFMELNYALLLAVSMGLSVIIPYVGATLVTFPVLIVAYFQWGVGDEFVYVVIAYSVIQLFDGAIMVPMLFSEVVNLHPVAIIVAILFFGGIWGFWGVFFAIPLASLVQAVLTAWPRITEQEASE